MALHYGSRLRSGGRPYYGTVLIRLGHAMTLTTGWCWRSRYGQSGPAPCERSEALVAQRSDVQGQRDPRRTLTSETSLAWLGANPDVRDNREMPAASRGSSPQRFPRRIQRNLGATAPKNPTGGGHRCRRLSLATMCERQESERLASSPARHPFLVTQGLVSGRQATPLRLAWALARKFSFKQTEPYARAGGERVCNRWHISSVPH